ncbi:uncharacterized protein LOC110737288 isoform X2 [Chenopodium quinoa]|uniref:uncharacterized protein LOC110737288 isoform X2 n=1 Tax=Chenopodium quinoa TaxID=63459 RepID=UPI000B78ABDF|nr:uncharacterized protein LOC110737288 isoform X2 [Chenopodium quinoa]
MREAILARLRGEDLRKIIKVNKPLKTPFGRLLKLAAHALAENYVQNWEDEFCYILAVILKQSKVKKFRHEIDPGARTADFDRAKEEIEEEERVQALHPLMGCAAEYQPQNVQPHRSN